MTDNMNPPLASIIAWIEEIRRVECASFVDVALRLPEVWSVIRAQGLARRTIAQACGWPLRLSRDAIQTQSANSLGVTLLNFGADCAIGLWQYAPRTCHLMHVEGKFHDACALVHASVAEATEDEASALEDTELHSRGSLEAGLRLDFEGVKRTLDARGEAHLRSLLPMMPEEGCATTGGWVLDLPSLIVARVLEHSRIAFEVPDSVRDPRARAAYPGGFHLTRASVVLGFGDPRHSQYEVASTATPRVVLVDEQLLDSPGWLVAFLHHVVESLAEVGVSAADSLGSLSLSAFVQLSPPEAAKKRS
jgi:hypothetical protein